MTDMQTFWNYLERKRQQLEWEGELSMGPVGEETLPQSIRFIQLELRDLMSQVSRQVAATFTDTILTHLIKEVTSGRADGGVSVLSPSSATFRDLGRSPPSQQRQAHNVPTPALGGTGTAVWKVTLF